MRYTSAGAFRRALETHFATRARDTSLSVVRLRKEVVFDRLLARLVAVAPERWVLKGALALDYRFGDRARTTKDIDLATAGDEASATADLLAAQAADLDDFFGFGIERTSALDRLTEGVAVRHHVRAELAGRVFDEFLLDVGFDPPTGIEFDRLRGPDLLAFADLARSRCPPCRSNFHVAPRPAAQAAPGRWVVKGGCANQLRRPDDARFTEDLRFRIDAAIETAPELELPEPTPAAAASTVRFFLGAVTRASQASHGIQPRRNGSRK